MGASGYDGYDGPLTDTSSATTAPRSYQPDARPSYQPDARPGSYRPDAQPGSYRPDSQPGSYQAAGDPYGSYVSADLPGYESLPPSGYQPGHSGHGFPGQQAGQENGHLGSIYRPAAPAGDPALPPGGRAGGWYPGMPAATAPVPAPPGPAALPGPGLQDRQAMPGYANGHGHPNGYVNGNGHRSPSGYSPAPSSPAPHPDGSYLDGRYPDGSYPDGSYPDRRNDMPGYQAGYGLAPEAPGYRAAGRHSAGRQDPAGYLPPEYGRDGYGGR